MQWFHNGPPVTTIPLPTADPSHPWGASGCNKCSGFCTGHYLTPEETLASSSGVLEPPSSILKKFLKGKEPSNDDLVTVARECLLPVTEVSLWLEHLSTIDRNRKRGAVKAAASRKLKKTEPKRCRVEKPQHKQSQYDQSQDQQPQDDQPQDQQPQDYYCGACEGLYRDSEDEYWIGCDGCLGWCLCG